MTTETKTVPNATNPEPVKVKEVDLYGIKLSLPEEQAAQLISVRDSRTAEFNQLKQMVDSITKEKLEAEAKMKSEAKAKHELELAKKGELDALKDSLTKEYKEKIISLEQTLIKQKIRDAVFAIESVNKKAIDDIVRLTENEKPVLEGDIVKVNEKPLSDFINSLISSRDYFQVVKTVVGTGQAQPIRPGNQPTTISPIAAIREGLIERLKK